MQKNKNLKSLEKFDSTIEAQVYKKIFENIRDGVMITDTNEVIISVNQAFCDITGYSFKEVIGKTPRILKSDKHDKNFYSELWGKLRKKGSWQGTIWNRHKNGDIYAEWINICSITNRQNEVEYYACIFSDITKIKTEEQKLISMAYYDPLTGLPNRLLFYDRLKQATLLCERENKEVALLFIDLDKFKPVNDTYGHHVGDLLLQLVSSKIENLCRKTDTVSRIGGDEFVIILIQEQGPDLLKGVEKIAKQILRILKKTYQIMNYKIKIGGSIGVSLYPSHTQNLDQLLNNADKAMYYSKSKGGNQFFIFDKEIIAMHNAAKK